MELGENIIVAAIQNRHKIRKMDAITAGFGMKIMGRYDARILDVEIAEDRISFKDNSYKNAYGIMKLCSAAGRPSPTIPTFILF